MLRAIAGPSSTVCRAFDEYSTPWEPAGTNPATENLGRTEPRVLSRESQRDVVAQVGRSQDLPHGGHVITSLTGVEGLTAVISERGQVERAARVFLVAFGGSDRPV